MKNPTFTIAILVLILFNLNGVNAQKFSGLDKSPMDMASYPSIHDDSNTLVKIYYSRPQLKGRSLKKLTPNGKVWRTGANEASEIIFYKDMKLGNTLIKAGAYTFATIPGEKEWVIILNSGLNVWGAYAYNQGNDIARLSVPVSTGKESLEAFSITFVQSDNGVNMILGWDKLRVAVPFTK